MHRLSLSTLCGNVFALSQPAPSSTPLETTYNHPTHTTTSPPPPSSLTSSAAAPDFGCEQVKKAKVSFPQFCLHPSSFLRYDPLGLPFSSLEQGHLSKSCLNRVLRPKYLSRERAHVRHVRLCERRGHLLQGSEHFVRVPPAKKRRAEKNGVLERPTQPFGGTGHQTIWANRPLKTHSPTE